MPSDENKFLTVEEVAIELHLKPRTVQDLCHQGKLGYSKPGRRYLIPRESLDEYLQIRR